MLLLIRKKFTLALDKTVIVNYILIKLINQNNPCEVIGMIQADLKKESCCASASAAASCCRVEALISVDERGQMVLPKELRDKANIKAGDKLALVSWEKGGEVCCLSLIKADNLAERVREFLGPVMRDVV
jgi:AbrB family looped-hinge helix DNA binding protein